MLPDRIGLIYIYTPIYIAASAASFVRTVLSIPVLLGCAHQQGDLSGQCMSKKG